MHVAIAGAHGKVARRLARRLSARGDRVSGLIRNADHSRDVRADGAQPVVCDLEHAGVEALADAVGGADAVVFAAGAGPGSGAARKMTMDRDGALKLIEAARSASVHRYVMVSAVGAGAPPDGSDVMSIYLRAKAQADQALTASGLGWTIIRPGGLTDEPGSALVRIETTPFRGQIPRDDVAATIEAVLDDSRVLGRILYVNGGRDPIKEALEAALQD